MERGKWENFAKKFKGPVNVWLLLFFFFLHKMIPDLEAAQRLTDFRPQDILTITIWSCTCLWMNSPSPDQEEWYFQCFDFRLWALDLLLWLTCCWVVCEVFDLHSLQSHYRLNWASPCPCSRASRCYYFQEEFMETQTWFCVWGLP